MDNNKENDTLPKRSGQRNYSGRLSDNFMSSSHVEANDWNNSYMKPRNV